MKEESFRFIKQALDQREAQSTILLNWKGLHMIN